MTVEALEHLKPGDRVMCRLCERVAIGRVRAADGRGVVIAWADGTESELLFAHCRDGRESRHGLLFAYARGRVAA